MGETRTIREWVECLRDYERSIKLEPGISRKWIDIYSESRHVEFPEDYKEFLELAGGADIFNGAVCIWSLPDKYGRFLTADGKPVPAWKNMEYRNSPKEKEAIPYSDGVFLIAANELGDVLGITREKPGYCLKMISPDMDDYWYYSDFASFLEDVWEEWILSV